MSKGARLGSAWLRPRIRGGGLPARRVILWGDRDASEAQVFTAWLFPAASGGASVGTLARQMGAATASGAARLAIAGASSAQLATLTGGGAATLLNRGTLAAWLGPATTAAAGHLTGGGIQGSLTTTLEAATLFAGGALQLSAAAAATLVNAQVAGAARLLNQGQTVGTLDDATASSVARLALAATLTSTLDAVQGAGAAALSLGAQGGSALQDATLFAGGALQLSAAAAATLVNAQGTGAARLLNRGAMSADLDAATTVAAGQLALHAQAAATLADVLSAGESAIGHPAGHLSPAECAATGVLPIAAQGACLLDSATCQADGRLIGAHMVLSAIAIDAISAAVWDQVLPQPDDPPPLVYGTHMPSAAERAAIAHAVWARSLP